MAKEKDFSNKGGKKFSISENSKEQGEFLDEITGYALRNAIEFGKAEAGKVLPKLFQHGLKKEDIGKVAPKVQEIVEKVNSWDENVRNMQLGKYEKYIKEREEEGVRIWPELKNVKKKPVFRVAPYPSGALHIGNAKTFLENSMYSERYGGKVILVMDDTIGSAEKQIDKGAYKLIKDSLDWLGIVYDKKIVYKSDRINIYYKYAKELIEKEMAYVCHCSQDEFKKIKEEGRECGCRQLPKKIQLLRWKEMFNEDEGHAVLRLKTDMHHPNPAFRDRVLFKISKRKHPRVGKKYSVWPTLEMSWSIDDHLLGITHIIRGNDLTIETEVEKYVWDIFGWKHPEIIHTGLIKIDLSDSGGKISKSKAQKEVRSGEYIGWEDPRTWSLQSLKMRGISKEAIREFVREIGMNKQDVTVPIESLYAVNRRMIDSHALRYFFVENGKRIRISGKSGKREVEIPVHPEKEETRKIKVGRDLYISESDFKRFSGKEIRLLHLFNVKLGVESEITSLENKDIPKIQWVSDSDRMEVRVLMPNGMWAVGKAEKGIGKIEKGEIVQFERFGFVKYDRQKDGFKEFWFAHK